MGSHHTLRYNPIHGDFQVTTVLGSPEGGINDGRAMMMMMMMMTSAEILEVLRIQ
jgi:hypothetical protein